MKHIFNLTSIILISFSLFFSSAASAAKGGNQPDQGDRGNNSSAADDQSDSEVTTILDSNEASHLIFMREEEKLARDVYLSFADMYPEQRVFAQIATESEQTHTDVMRDKLTQYNISDPNPDTNNLPESIGIFKGEEWGLYFTEKFEVLTKMGAVNEMEALYAGAFIEELDMHDIAECPAVMVDAGYDDPCGLHYTDESGLINAYRSLIDGSESHLRAYVGQIEAVIGVGNYEAQYLSQDEVDAILSR